MAGLSSQQIAHRLRDEVGIDIAIEEVGTVLRLTGMVDSRDARQMAREFVADLATDRQIEDRLEVEAPAPAISETEEFEQEEALAQLEPLADIEERMDADLAERQTERAALSITESGEVVAAPSDPVVEDSEVVGGFELTSMDAVEVDASEEDAMPGDEALAEAIRRELREDASTTDLHIDVLVEDRVAHLRGQVSGPEDVENAEAVAARVPRVIEVVEELEFRQP